MMATLFDTHVWGIECDKCGSELCGKMNDPEFVRHLKEEGKL
jgi:hypothetical protein